MSEPHPDLVAARGAATDLAGLDPSDRVERLETIAARLEAALNSGSASAGSAPSGAR